MSRESSALRHHQGAEHLCLIKDPVSQTQRLLFDRTRLSLCTSAGSMILFLLTCVCAVELMEVMEVGGASSTCPAVCRCEGERVDCVGLGLRTVPCELSGSITFLSLHNNLLTSVHPAALSNLSGLRSLRLDANRLSVLSSSSFSGPSSLRYLRLDDNLLTEVPVLALSRQTELQALTLNLNLIRSIPDGAFSSLHQLLLLHLHNNRIQSVGPRSFKGLINLETLDLSFNRIKSLPAAITHLRNLRHLNLQNNLLMVPQRWSSVNAPPPRLPRLLLNTDVTFDLQRSQTHLQPSTHRGMERHGLLISDWSSDREEASSVQLLVLLFAVYCCVSLILKLQTL